ncbi:MAG: metal ABC transporter ATP-binding protein [Spirochaetia bacterium]|jgi:zinc transport system ATP-binding protein|nr:metal ABC transporter ATP-binding protein [Spirochaetia bacterium]
MDNHPAIAVEFSKVNYTYSTLEVLNESSFHVHQGEFVALIGSNGSGKTTILRLIMGLARPDSGRIQLFGKSPEKARGLVGYVPQYMNYDPAFPISVEEVVKMGRLEGLSRNCESGRPLASSCPELETALELADVAYLRGRPYKALSGGQRRRVMVARALASAPKLLILDEPTANMDSESEERLFNVLGNLKQSTTILIATHDTAFVSSLTDVVLCVGQREGRPGGVLRHAAKPADHIPAGLYGGSALQVLHDTDLPDECCAPEAAGRITQAWKTGRAEQVEPQTEGRES